MPKVQKPLPGLAKFLGIETSGLLTLDAQPSVSPIIEIEDYLGPNKWTIVNNATLAPNGNLQIPVPDKKFWRVRWLGCYITPTVAQSTNAYFHLVKNVGGTQFRAGLNPPFMTGGATFREFLFVNGAHGGYGFRTRDLNAEPGDILELDLESSTGGTFNTIFYAQYQELDL